MNCRPHFFRALAMFLLAAPAIVGAEPVSTISVELEDPPEQFQGNLGSKGEFEAQVWALPEQPRDPGYGMKYWERQPIETVNALNGPLVIGEMADVWIILKNPAIDNKKRSGILVDMLVRRPDGSILWECRNTSAWVSKEPFPRDEFITAEVYFELKLNENEPPGIYTIETVVKDIPGNVKIPLVTQVEFVLPRS